MPTYKNLSKAVKTFYGVTFLPGEVKSVSGYINNTKFARVSDPVEVPEQQEIKTVVTTEGKTDITKPVREDKSKPTRKYTKKSTTLKED